jgi:hypothetical protein
MEGYYIEYQGKEVPVRIIVRHQTSKTYLVIDDETKQQYQIPFKMLLNKEKNI